MPVSRANGVDIYYEKDGSGPALDLLHPAPYDHRCWLYQVAHFSQRFTTIAIDLRSLGRSGKPTTPFTAQDLCDDVMGVLADEGISKAVIMGCSFGSKVSLTLSIHHPHVFQATILAGGISGTQHNLDDHIPYWHAQAAAGTVAEAHRFHLLRGVTGWWAETPIGRFLIDAFSDRGKYLVAESYIRLYEALLWHDLTPHLATFETPLLIINGEHDPASPGGARTASLVTHAERRILPGLGHCSFMEGPAEFDALVEDFLSRKGLWPAAA
jgi:pimeloyl-ACP methyl ester carboxylesterase